MNEASNRILIVDDEPDIGRLIASVASRCGYEAHATIDAEVFRERIQTWNPSHIVIDLNMPAVDGVELIRYLAEEGCKAHVMIASGFDSKVIDSVRQLGIERGLSISGTLQKPIRVDTLQAMLEQLRNDDDWLTEKELTRAIDTHALHLLFQPKVKIAAGSANGRLWSHMVGFESLVRWNRHGTPVSPADFIPMAEELGIIEPLGTWVMQQACAKFVEWKARYPQSGLDYITVNVSAKQLVQQGFIYLVERTVEQNHMRPEELRLEITETALMDAPQFAAQVLTELRQFGVKIYLDDFGTGYSSLSHLHKLPVDALKIDRSFVRGLLMDDRPAIVESILALAKTLQTNVVAEGIEEEAQANELERLGCRLAQGYFFSRPLPADKAELLLAAGQPLGTPRFAAPQLARAPRLSPVMTRDIA